MIRRIFHTIGAVVFLLFLVAIAMWIRSRRSTDTRAFSYDGVRWQIVSKAGSIRIENAPQLSLEQLKWQQDVLTYDINVDRSHRRFAAMSARYNDAPFGSDDWKLLEKERSTYLDTVMRNPPGLVQSAAVVHHLRYATLTAVTAGVSIPWLAVTIQVRRARRRSKREGLCPACGYDLRASFDRCPECGRVVGDIISD